MKAVIYARYSPGSRQTEQSIEGQMRDCYAFCQREDLQVVGEYIDRGITGRYDDRPEFQRMVQDAKKKQFDYIVVWKLDRFARNRYDSAVYKHKLREAGVRVLSAMENIGEGDESIILEAVLEASAEYYSRDVAKKVTRGLRESAMKGTSVGARAPFGYKVVKKHYCIDEEKAPLVKWMFEQYAAGVSKKEIIAELNRRGVRTYRGNPLTASSMHAVFRNRKYIGDWNYNGITMPVDVAPIITPELFNAVQEKLALVRNAPGARKARADYQLQGKIYCGYCGASMIGESGRSRSGEKHYYYACRTRKTKHACHKKNEKKDFLEWYVVEQTLEYVLRPERIQEIAMRVAAMYEEEFNGGRTKELQRRIGKLDLEINKCFDIVLQSTSRVVAQKAEEKADLLDMQKRELEIDLAKLELATGIQYTAADIAKWLQQFCKGDIMDKDFRRRIIDVFVNAVYLFDDHMVVFYNIRGGKQVSYIEMLDATAEITPDADSGPNDQLVRFSCASVHQDVSKPNQPRFIFKNGLFGCFFPRA